MSFLPSTKGRAWMATVHIANFENMELTEEQYKNPEFLADYLIKLWEDSGKGRQAAAAICISAEKLYHAHLALYGNTTTLKKVADILHKSHVEPQLGGKKELTNYLLKEPPYDEKDETVLFVKNLTVIQDSKGNRSDLDDIEEMIDSGMTPASIFAESIRYRKYEKMIKAAYLQKVIDDMPLVKEMDNVWHFGRSGTGKTYTYIKLCEEYGDDNVYLCNDYSNSSSSGGGFDQYAENPAKILVLDEFRENMPYNTLLSILDVYSRNQIHCRYANVYALWESVHVCSIYAPDEVYHFMVEDSERRTDSSRQLLRRLNTVVYHYIKDGKYKTYEMPASEYRGKDHMIALASLAEANQPATDIKGFINDWGATEVKGDKDHDKEES